MIYSANGLLSHPTKPPGDACVGVLREVAVAAALATGVAAITLEKFTFGGLVYWGVIGRAMGDKWLLGQWILNCIIGIFVVGVHSIMRWTLLMMVSCCSPFFHAPYTDLTRTKSPAL